MVSGHLSNWELTAFAFSELYNPMYIAAKPQKNKQLDEKINNFRKLNGNKIIYTGYNIRELFNLLNSGNIISFLVDQSAHSEYSEYVSFFGKEVPSFAGPAQLALKYNIPVYWGNGVRNPDYSYNVNLKQIVYNANKNLTAKENIHNLTQSIQKHAEDAIRANPGQWVWQHKRFKHAKA